MSEQATSYTCPNCGGSMHYDAALGKLKCDYCDSVFSVEEVKKAFAEKNQKGEEQGAKRAQSAEKEDWGGNVRTFHCPNCGAELVTDETTVSMTCPYCGNPAVLAGKFADVRKPDYVIPFRIQKEQAVEKLKQYYRNKKLLPGSFARDNQVKKIQGVYVPYWLFSGSVYADVAFEGTNSETHREGDFEVTRTRHYDVRRAGTVAFSRIPADGSTRMADDLMDSVEPYDYGKLCPFAYEYLPGYAADKYDVEAKDCEARADMRAANTAVEAMRSTVTGYGAVAERGRRTTVHREKTEYAMMPVWMLHTKWNGKDFCFAMNGETGKMTGNLPVSPGRAAAWFAGIMAVWAVLLLLVLSLIDGEVTTGNLLIALLCGGVAATITIGAMVRQMKPVQTATRAAGYVREGGVRLEVSQDRYTHTTETRIRVESPDREGPHGGGPGGPGGPGGHRR